MLSYDSVTHVTSKEYEIMTSHGHYNHMFSATLIVIIAKDPYNPGYIPWYANRPFGIHYRELILIKQTR